MTTRTLVPTFALALAVSVSPGPAFAADTPREAEAGSAAGVPLSLDDCRAIWNLAAGRSDLGPDQAKPYVPDFSAVDTNGDGKITNAEFRAGCEKGLVHRAKRAD